jgi:endonuclease I
MKNTHSLKKIVTIIIAFCTLQVFSQIPAGYYDSSSGLTGNELKSSLHQIIDNHIEFPYTSNNTDVWDILKEADRDPNNTNNVIGIYSGFSMVASEEYANGNGWNREHVWAKSRGDFGTTLGAGTDAHHLRAADISTNSARNNRNFDNCTDPYTDESGIYSGPTESFTSSSEYVWQPRASVKGDVARMLFYMTVRYEGTNGEQDLELTEVLLSDTDKTPFHAKTATLLQWHKEDPVDAAERTRNDIVYSYQQNRNPFIDHPEYVCEIYTCDAANAAPVFTSTPITTAAENEVYTYDINASDSDGDVLIMTAATKPTWLTFEDNGNGTGTLSGTPSRVDAGLHAIVLEISDGVATSATQQTFDINVNAEGEVSNTELFFSEYIEGSSYNKGLEIANFTGTAVNLAEYSIFKQTNGAGTWSSELSLSGTIANEDVYVIVNTSANTEMQAVTDLATGSGSMTFNGNDPVALFKNGTLIDVIGTFNSTSKYAENKTLVRSAFVSKPNLTYTVSEWEVFTTDTSTDLGMHTFSKELNTFTADGNWSEAAKWTRGVPISNSDIIIADNIFVTIDTDDISIRNFTLNTEAKMVIPKDKEVTINGNLLINGVLSLESDVNSSGVLFVKGTTSGTVTYKRGGLIANEWSLVSTPFSGQKIISFAENIENDLRTKNTDAQITYAIGSYDDSKAAGDKWQYYNKTTTEEEEEEEEFSAGIGYSMSRNTDGAVSFTGALNINNISKNVTTDQWVVVGNPYTTYLAANKNGNSSFLDDNFDALNDNFKGLYVWDNSQEKYTAVSEVDAVKRSFAPGQGFFVKLKNGQTNIIFNQDKRQLKNGGTIEFSKNVNLAPEIVVSVSNKSLTVKTNIKYFKGVTKGLDPGFDIGNYNGASFDAFTHLVEDSTNVNYTIQSLPNIDLENMIIPLGLKAASGSELVFAAESIDLPGVHIIIEDRALNVFKELNESSTYLAIINTNTSGVGRFYIHAKQAALNIAEDQVLNGVNIYLKENTSLIISGLKGGLTKVKIYSFLGKQVFKRAFVGSGVKDISIPTLVKGVYFLKLQTKEGNLTKKIILE